MSFQHRIFFKGSIYKSRFNCYFRLSFINNNYDYNLRLFTVATANTNAITAITITNATNKFKKIDSNKIIVKEKKNTENQHAVISAFDLFSIGIGPSSRLKMIFD